MDAQILIVGLAPIVGALFCVTVAGIKNRDLASWFLLGLVASVVSAIVVCWVPALDPYGQPRRARMRGQARPSRRRGRATAQRAGR